MMTERLIHAEWEIWIDVDNLWIATILALGKIQEVLKVNFKCDAKDYICIKVTYIFVLWSIRLVEVDYVKLS